MAYYLVKARARANQLAELKARLDRDEFLAMRPFGLALTYSLQHARLDPQGWAVWEEEDYCQPPLAMDRAAVLDTYFTDLSVEKVQQNAGWQQIDPLPSLWAEELPQ
jgi:hypothetical protein